MDDQREDALDGLLAVLCEPSSADSLRTAKLVRKSVSDKGQLFAIDALIANLKDREPKLKKASKLSVLDAVTSAAALLRMLVATSEPSLKAGLSKALQELLSELAQRLEDESGDYPTGSINAAVWMSGLQFTRICQGLLGHYEREEDLQGQLVAAFNWAKVTNATMSHYPHEVGPAMVATGDCYMKLEDSDKAQAFFDAVIADFEWFVDTYGGDSQGRLRRRARRGGTHLP